MANPKRTITLENGYTPAEGYVKDFSIVIDSSGVYHLFHITGQRGKGCFDEGNEVCFGHATSPDLWHWTEEANVLTDRPDRWEGAHVYAPYVLAADNQYYMFYTGLNSTISQRIGLATSRDLFHWERSELNPVFDPMNLKWARWENGRRCGNCRDPHVLHYAGFYEDDYQRGLYILYYTGLTSDKLACVGAATSHDLLRWEDKGPVISRPISKAGTWMLESSHVFEHDDKYYLVWNNGQGLHYAISHNPLSWQGLEDEFLMREAWSFECLFTRAGRSVFAYFDKEMKLRLGILEWNGDRPTVIRIAEAAQLRELLAQHRKNRV